MSAENYRLRLYSAFENARLNRANPKALRKEFKATDVNNESVPKALLHVLAKPKAERFLYVCKYT